MSTAQDNLPKGWLRRLARLPLRALAAAAVAAVVMLGGAVWILGPASSVSTDDAYVEADSTVVASRIQGLIAKVLVRDNQVVNAGQILVEIDPRDFEQAVAAANAGAAAAEADLHEQDAREKLAAANTAAAEAAVRAAGAEAARAAADDVRYAHLRTGGYVSQSQADAIHAAALKAAAGADSAHAACEAAVQQETATLRTRDQLVAALAKAKATLAAAGLDLSYTTVRAPVSGIVGDRQARVGQFVQPGTQLLTLVPMNTLYVTANFKETQTARILVGQHARILVDALPHDSFAAQVDSLAPGSGSSFALLPFEPANGNFTRIVQRVPVRLRLAPGQSGWKRLRPGLSANVTVELERQGSRGYGNR